MPEKITSDMLAEFGPTIQGLFEYVFPHGVTPEELKNSEHRILRGIYNYFKEKEGA